MVEATKVKAKPVAAVKEVEPEKEMKDLVDVCTNPDCMGLVDLVTGKVTKPYVRVAVRPSDMLCPCCESRLEEKRA